MKKKDLQDFRSKDIQELTRMIQEKVIEARRLKAEIGLGRQKNIRQTKNTRLEIAQLKSILREKELKGTNDAKNISR